MKAFLFTAMLMLVMTCCHSEPFYNHSQLHKDVLGFASQTFPAKDHYQIKVASLDPRLKLSQCNVPEAFSLRSGEGARRIVQISCESNHPWKIYVPINISKMQDAAVARHPLSRGRVLSEDDIIFTKIDILRQHHGVFTQLDDLVGNVIKRSVREGDVYTPSMLRMAEVVKRGQGVLIVAKKGTLQVQMRGVAQKAGAIGDIIKVQNVNSKRVVEAEIIDVGQVKVVL